MLSLSFSRQHFAKRKFDFTVVTDVFATKLRERKRDLTVVVRFDADKSQQRKPLLTPFAFG
jgi:hypothetical protein